MSTIDIIFDGPPSHESGRFVEVERDGKSINYGEWEERDDGLWALRIFDPVEHEATIKDQAAHIESLESLMGTEKTFLNEVVKSQADEIEQLKAENEAIRIGAWWNIMGLKLDLIDPVKDTSPEGSQT